jgi:hypothetical protein
VRRMRERRAAEAVETLVTSEVEHPERSARR